MNQVLQLRFVIHMQMKNNSSIHSSLKVSDTVVSDSVIPWTVARQAPLSLEFSRQEY